MTGLENLNIGDILTVGETTRLVYIGEGKVNSERVMRNIITEECAWKVDQTALTLSQPQVDYWLKTL